MVVLKGPGDITGVGVDAKTPVAFTDYGTPPAVNVLTGGWNDAKYYGPEIDASGDIVFLPSVDSAVFMVKTGGKTWQDVQAEHPETTITDLNQAAVRIRQNPAWGYGTTDALALEMELALRLVITEFSNNFQSPWLLFKRGDSFPSFLEFGPNEGSFERPGESATRPIVISHYGDPGLAKPHFDGAGPRLITGASNIIVSGVSRGGNMLAAGSKYFGLDDISADGSTTLDPGIHGGTTMQSTVTEGFKHAFMSRLNLQDISITVPLDPNGLWTFSDDRGSSMYLAVGIYVKLDRIFSLYSGWGPGYSQGGSVGTDQPPDDRSHGGYSQHSLFGLSVSDMFIMEPNFNAFQFRQGAVTQDLFTYRPNSGFFYGAQIADGNFSYAHRVTHIGAGWKQWVGNANGPGAPTVVAEGPVVNMPQFPIFEFLQANSGTGAFFGTTDATEVANGSKLVASMGQQERGVRFANPTVATELVGSFSTATAQNYALANWSNVTDQNVTVSEASQIDALSLGDWLDAHLGANGSTEADFRTWIRAEAEPWKYGRELQRYFGAPLGWNTPPRTAAATCTYSPASEAPPLRADIYRNWSTGDLPKTGDTLVINHEIQWNGISGTFPSVTFGAMADVKIYGGALKATSLTVNAVQTVTIDAARFEIGAHSGSRLTVQNLEGDFTNTGTITGSVNVSNFWGAKSVLAEEGGSFTLDASGVINVYGSPVHDNRSTTRVGFDGYSGGTASATINGTINFRPGVWMKLSGTTPGSKLAGIRGGVNAVTLTDSLLPNEGDVITSSGGASGVVRKIMHTKPSGGNLDFWIYVTDVAGGVFSDGETLSATTLYLREIFTEGTGNFATINGAPSVSMGAIGEVKTGKGPAIGELPAGFNAEGRGAQDPNVVSQITLESGANITADTAGLAAGSYDLIDVDALTDNGATLGAGLAVVSNRLVLTVT